MAVAVRQRLIDVIHHRRFVLACVLVGTTVRLIWVGFVHPDQVSDFKWYLDRAVVIANGEGYSVNGLPTAYWPVGFPGFLGILFSIFGSSPFTGQLANVVLSAATIFLGYRLSLQLFQSETAARVTALILCLHPNQIAYNSLLCSEIWFTFLFLSGVISFLAAHGRVSLLALCGICWGLGTLTKPQFFLFPAMFLLVFYAGKKQLLKSAAIIYATILLCLLPWCIRNQRVMGKFMLSTNGGFTLLQGNNPYATGTYIWIPEMEAMMGDLQKSPTAALEYDEVRRDKRAWEVAAGYMKEHPLRTAALWPKKVMYMYRSDIDGFFYSMGMMKLSAQHWKLLYVGLRIFGELYYIFVLGLAAWSFTALRRRLRPKSTAGLFVALYFTSISVVFVSIARYHFPIIPWIAAYSGVGAALLLGAWYTSPLTTAIEPSNLLDSGVLSRPETARAKAAGASSRK